MKTILQKLALSLFFLTSFLNPSSAQNWEYVGIPNFPANSAFTPSLALNANGVPYVAFTSPALGGVCVMSFNGNEWDFVGAPGFSPGGYISMAIRNNNIPYVAFSDPEEQGRVSVMRLNGNEWVHVGSPGFSPGTSASYVSLAINDSGEPFVAFSYFEDGTILGKVMKFEGNDGGWTTVGLPFYSATSVPPARYSLAISSSGTLYVSFNGPDNDFVNPTVMRNNGGNWEDLGSPNSVAAINFPSSIAIGNDDVPYVAYSGSTFKTNVKKFDESQWVSVGAENFSAGSAIGQSLAFNTSGEPFVAYTDGFYSDKATVMKFNGEEWIVAGLPGFTTYGASDCSLAINNNGEPYLAFMNSMNSDFAYRVNVMKFSNNLGVLDYEVLNISLFPNPSNGDVALTNLPIGKTKIKIFDIKGKELVSKNTNTTSTTINTSDFKNGVYLIKIENNGNSINKKLIINN
jgi:hypothetical protein